MATTEPSQIAHPAHVTMSTQQHQIEIAWSAALEQLRSGKTTVDLPFNVTLAIGEQGLSEVLTRYSDYINATGSMVHDAVNNAWRFLPPPHFHGSTASPASSTQSAMSQPPQVTHSAVTIPRIPLPEPEKVRDMLLDLEFRGPPRPMNSFILYRKEKHPLVVAAHPGLPISVISQIIGRMWRNEPQHVRDEYRARAQALAFLHRNAHPEYRYAPRKPSEIKRRKKTNKTNKANKVNKVNKNNKANKANKKGKVSGEFHVSDAPLNFVEPSSLEKDARDINVLASGPVNSNPTDTVIGGVTKDDLMAMYTTDTGLPWVNMGQLSRIDQQAYAAVLDNNELVRQAQSNADATTSLANDIAHDFPTLFSISHPFNGNFELNTDTSDDFDPLTAAAQRNANLVAEGALESFNDFTFPEREPNFSFDMLNSGRNF